ncbi:hypothetical protein MTP99_003978 [Tenebrio molitor]|nr:hypothetical protein MTP99_003978 [Tenebrio molitor]
MERFLIRKPNLTQAQTEVSHSLNLEFAGSDEGTVTIDNTEVICSPDPESDRGDEGAINIDNLRNKKRIYSNLRKCREQWQQEFKWLASRDNKAYCKSCRKFLEGGRRHMKRHEICQLHKKNETPYARGKLVEKMNSSKFAIIIDETTDVSSKKSLVIAS